MNANRACITGLGAISAVGLNIKETLDNFKKGTRNLSKVSLFNTDLNCPVFEVKNFSYDISKQMRTLALCLQAVSEALERADLKKDLNKFRIGVCLGTTVASQLNDIDFYKAFCKDGFGPMEAVNKFLKGNLSQAVLKEYKLNGPACTVVNACSSGTDAIGIALSWLKDDQCDIVIAGGADELSRIPVAGFNSLSVTSDCACAPFDRDRKGLNLGEGAGIVILEKEEVVLKRKVKPQGYLLGYSSNCDAYHLTAPRPDGTSLEYSILQVLKNSNLNSQDISFVNAHGTATRDNDKTEGSVLLRVFGRDLKFVSTKGYTGHTLGAAGGLEAVFSVLALNEGWIPANAGFINQDDEIGISPVKEVTAIKGKYALSTSLAFGGNNSVILLSKM